MTRTIDTDSTDQSIRFWAYDSDGAAVTGEVYNSAGMSVSVIVRQSGRIASTIALTLVARSGAGIHTDSALTEVGSGEYVVDLPDSYFATDGDHVSVTVASTAITGSVVVESLTVSNGVVNGIAGTITTLDALDTAQDTQHGTTRTAVDDAFTVIKGATWSGTTDTLEAIRDRGDVAWITGAGGGGGSGTGARTITVTIDDGTDPLENAIVRMTEGVNTYTALSDVTGVATFNLDDATYVVAITKSGYSYAGTTLVVDGDEAETYSLTQVTPTIPDDPALCTVTIPVVNQYGAALVGEVVEIRFNQFTDAATATAVVLSPPPTLTSDADGNVVVELLRDADYSVFYGQDDYIRRLDFSVPDADSYAVGE